MKRLLALSLVLSACTATTSPAAPATQAAQATAAPQAAQATAAPQAAAASGTLTILDGTVSLKHAGGAYAAASDGQTVVAGDSLKTGDKSHAFITYFDGSTAEIEPLTELSLTVVAASADGDSDIQMTQITGHTWHVIGRHLSDKSKYIVNTDTGSASVAGTAFDVINAPNQPMHIKTATGTVKGNTKAGTVDVPQGTETKLTSIGAAPGPATKSPEDASVVKITIDPTQNATVTNDKNQTVGIVDGKLHSTFPGALATFEGGKIVITVKNVDAGKLTTQVQSAADAVIQTQVSFKGAGVVANFTEVRNATNGTVKGGIALTPEGVIALPQNVLDQLGNNVKIGKEGQGGGIGKFKKDNLVPQDAPKGAPLGGGNLKPQDFQLGGFQPFQLQGGQGGGGGNANFQKFNNAPPLELFGGNPQQGPQGQATKGVPDVAQLGKFLPNNGQGIGPTPDQLKNNPFGNAQPIGGPPPGLKPPTEQLPPNVANPPQGGPPQGLKPPEGQLPPGAGQLPPGAQPPQGLKPPEGQLPPGAGQLPPGAQPPQGLKPPAGQAPPGAGQQPPGAQPPQGLQPPQGIQPGGNAPGGAPFDPKAGPPGGAKPEFPGGFKPEAPGGFKEPPGGFKEPPGGGGPPGHP